MKQFNNNYINKSKNLSRVLGRGFKSNLNFGDFHFAIMLAMPETFGLSGFGLVFDAGHLFATAISNNHAFNLALDDRSAYFHFVAISDE